MPARGEKEVNILAEGEGDEEGVDGGDAERKAGEGDDENNGGEEGGGEAMR